jgi:hypothetical protein
VVVLSVATWAAACSEDAPKVETPAIESPPPKPEVDKKPAVELPIGLLYQGPASEKSEPSAYELTPWPAGATVFAAADGMNVRETADTTAKVAGKLPLAHEVRVVKAVGEPVRVGGRVDRWYEVEADGEAGVIKGFVFGGALTHLAGFADLDGDTFGEAWAATFTKRGTLAVRVAEPRAKDPKKRATATVVRVKSDDKKTIGGTADVRVRAVETDSADDAIPGVLLAKTCRGGECRWSAIAYTGGEETAGKLKHLHGVDGEPEPDVFLKGPIIQVTKDARRAFYRHADKGWIKAECPGCGSRKLSDWEATARSERAKIEWESEGPDDMARITNCDTLGRITSGPREGSDVVQCPYDDGGKSGPSEISPFMYAAQGNTWVELDGASPVPPDVELFEKKGITFKKDGGVTLTGWINRNKHSVIFDDGYGVVRLQHWVRGELEGVRFVFAHRELGPVYTSGDGVSGPLADALNGTTHGAGDGLFVATRGGGVGMYAWRPKWRPEDIQWDDPAMAERVGDAGYTSGWLRECGEQKKLNNVVSSVDRAQLQKAGTVTDEKGNAHDVYTLPPTHGLVKGFEDAAKKWGTSDKLEGKLPFFLVEDSFGRLIQMSREEVDPPDACEPVIYVYAPRTMRVDVRVGGMGIFRSRPPARDGGWSVFAREDGRVRVPGDAWRDYLFWEGDGPDIPFPSHAFVVEPADVRGLLRRVLPQLGLEGREVRDLVRYWAPRLEREGRIALGFHTGAQVDELAPLSIDPAPDHAIRVWLDYRPAADDEAFEPPRLPDAPPARGGLTVVEWGGVMR